MAKTTILTKDDYEQVTEQAELAQELLTDDRWQFVRDYFNSTIQYAQETIWNDTVTDSEERVSVSEKIVRVFKRTKSEQIKELVGQYKLATKFFEDLQYYIKLKAEMDAQIKLGRMKVKGGGKDTNG